MITLYLSSINHSFGQPFFWRQMCDVIGNLPIVALLKAGKESNLLKVVDQSLNLYKHAVNYCLYLQQQGPSPPLVTSMQGTEHIKFRLGVDKFWEKRSKAALLREKLHRIQENISAVLPKTS